MRRPRRQPPQPGRPPSAGRKRPTTERAPERGWTPADVPRVLLVLLALLLPLVGGKLLDWQTATVGAALLLVAALAAAGRLRQRTAPALMPMELALGPLLIWLALQAPRAPYLHGALLALLMLLAYWLCFRLGRELGGEPRWAAALAGALVAGGTLVAVLGGREYLETLRTTGDASWRIFGPFFNPNLLAGYLLVTLPVGVALAVRYWRPREGDSPALRPLTLAAVALMALAFPLTGSKGGALGALAAAVIFAWTAAAPGSEAGRRLRRTVLILLAAGIALSLLLPPLRGRVTAAFSTESHSMAFRYHTWAGMLEMIRARPLTGWGPRSFEYTYPRFAAAGFTRSGHQSYLEVATEGGLPALALYLALWTAAGLTVAGRLRRARGEQRLLPAAAGAALAGFLVHNLVDYSWYCPAVSGSLLLLLGAVTAGDEPGHATPAESGPGGRALGIVLPAAATALLLTLAVTLLPAQYLRARAQAAREARAPTVAAAHLQAALRYTPTDADLWVELSVARAARGDAASLAGAIEAREQAARLRPTEAANWRRLAELHALRRDLPAARAAAQRAVEVYPTYVLGLATLARLAEQAGDAQAAAAAWQRLAELYDTPVGRYPALGDLVDPTYLWGWEFLARRAQPAGEPGRALGYRRRMAEVLSRLYELPPRERLLLRMMDLLPAEREAEVELMARRTVQALRESGEPGDEALATALEQARRAAQAGNRPAAAN